MDVSSVNGSAQISESIKALNDMLKNMQGASMNVSNKLMKVTVAAKVQGLGENIDIKG